MPSLNMESSMLIFLGDCRLIGFLVAKCVVFGGGEVYVAAVGKT